MKLVQSVCLILLVALFTGCKTAKIKPAAEYAITPINDPPIMITPQTFGKALLFNEKINVDSGKVLSKRRINFVSSPTTTGIDYTMTMFHQGDKINFTFDYNKASNSVTLVSIQSDNKEAEKIMRKMDLGKMLESSFVTKFYDTDLITGKAYSVDASSHAEHMLAWVQSMTDEPIDFIIKEANGRVEVMGIAVVNGRQALAVDLEMTISMGLRDGGGQSTMSMKTEGYQYIDIETGLMLRDDQYSNTVLDGKTIQKERSLTRFVRFM